MVAAYQELSSGSIRLLALHSGFVADPLSCTLQEASLESTPEFEAVSYVRGPSDLTDTLIVYPDGISLSAGTSCAISITSETASLLHSLRSVTVKRVLWIDSICVNQADEAERSAQAHLVQQIYTRAHLVISWLGPASENGSSDRGLKFLKRMAMHRKFNDRGEYLGGQRVGSDTSSECGTGRRADVTDEEYENEDESEEGDEGYGSYVTSEENSILDGSETSSTPSSDAQADLERATESGSLPSTFRYLRLSLFGCIDSFLWSLQSKYRHYFVYGYWNPYRSWRISQAWERAVIAWNLNQSRIGHIAFGRPVLYENNMEPFFQERYHDDWAAVDQLLTRPWWSQVWTVPVAWSPNHRAILQCGQQTIKWKTLQKALPYQEAWDDMGGTMADAEDPRIEKWPQLRERYRRCFHLCRQRLFNGKLSDLLWSTWDREADDPRDKIFASMSLVGKYDGLLQPDYRKITRDVFCEAARDIIRTEDSLDILLAAGGMREEFDGGPLPTWVPDWRKEKRPSKGRPKPLVDWSRMNSLYVTGSIISLVINGHGFTACADEKAVAWFGDDFATLHVHAILIGKAGASMSPPHNKELPVKCTVDTACQISSAAFKHGLPRWWDKKERDGQAGLVKRVLMAGSRGTMSEDEAIEDTMSMRGFFITEEENYLCVGPESTQYRDKIFIVAGCNVPLVLREKADGETKAFELVGDAYVHGLMHGEAIMKIRARNWRERLAWWRPSKQVRWVEIAIR